MWNSIVLLARFIVLRNSRLWRVTREAVERVRKHEHIQKAAEIEEITAFCPRCGQIPDGDRRMEAAREIAVELMKAAGYKRLRRSHLDFAIVYHFWAGKEDK